MPWVLFPGEVPYEWMLLAGSWPPPAEVQFWGGNAKKSQILYCGSGIAVQP